MTPPFLSSATLYKLGTIQVQFESDVVRARNIASSLAQEMLFDKTSSIRIGTAVSELSRNMIEHANGGIIDFHIAVREAKSGIIITFKDKGHGIAHLDEIKSGAFKSAKGMGVGLIGSQRLMDDFDIKTIMGQGTEISIAKWLLQHRELLTLSKIESLTSAFNKIIERGESSMIETINAQNNEVLFLLKNLQERNEEIEIINKELEETNRGVVALNRELEDRAIAIEKAKQQAEQANKAKSDFLAHMSHEIRTPMNAILGFTELLQKTELNKIQSQYVDNVNNAGRALLEIINDILDFSKIEAGKLDLDIVETDLIELLDHVLELFRYSATKKELDLLLTVQPGIPQVVMVDPVRLKQILINLISNAIKFTDKGEVELKVEYQIKTTTACELIFSVRDTGIGITEDQKLRLFKAFSQADGSTTRKFGGTGLGLVISNLLTKKMEGNLTFQSKSGVGSIFGFNLKTENKPNVTKDIFKPIKKVLLFDSGITHFRNFIEHLNFHNINFTFSEDLFEALLEIRSDEYCLIVANNNIPELEHIKIADRILDTTKLCSRQPLIVFLNKSQDDSDENLIFGEQPFLKVSKPINVIKLFDLLRSEQEFFNYVTPSDDNATTTNNNRNASETTDILNKKTILIAEDVEMNMILTKTMVHDIRQNIEILEAQNGLEALEIIAKKQVDLILMDVQMPKMDGLEATRKLRENNALKNLPIIALTAGALLEEKNKALESGMNEFLTKPMERNKLKSILDKYL